MVLALVSRALLTGADLVVAGGAAVSWRRARIEGLGLVTADRAMQAYDVALLDATR